MKVREFAVGIGGIFFVLFVLFLAYQGAVKPTRSELDQAMQTVTIPASAYRPRGWITSRPGHIRLIREDLADYVRDHLKGFKERTFEIEVKHRHDNKKANLKLVIFQISELREAYNWSDEVETPDYIVSNQVDPEEKTYATLFRHDNQKSPYAQWDIIKITVVD